MQHPHADPLKNILLISLELTKNKRYSAGNVSGIRFIGKALSMDPSGINRLDERY